MNADQYSLDKAQVRLAFSRAAQDYDAHAVLQSEVRAQMLERLDLLKSPPTRILDLGCGTGVAGAALAKQFKHAHIISLDLSEAMLEKARAQHGGWGHWLQKGLAKLGFAKQQQHHYLCADMERLPLADASVDMVWSNLALQWCNDLDATFAEIHRVLKPDGALMFASFGPDTLKELRLASQQVDGHIHVNRFIDMHDVGDALVRAGFAGVVLDVDYFTLQYAAVIDLMRDLKAIGAHNAAQGRRRGLSGRRFLQDLAQAYEAFRRDDKLPASYEVVYGHAWRPQQKPSTKFDMPDVAPINFVSKKDDGLER